MLLQLEKGPWCLGVFTKTQVTTTTTVAPGEVATENNKKNLFSPNECQRSPRTTVLTFNTRHYHIQWGHPRCTSFPNLCTICKYRANRLTDSERYRAESKPSGMNSWPGDQCHLSLLYLSLVPVEHPARQCTTTVAPLVRALEGYSTEQDCLKEADLLAGKEVGWGTREVQQGTQRDDLCPDSQDVIFVQTNCSTHVECYRKIQIGNKIISLVCSIASRIKIKCMQNYQIWHIF